MKKIATMVSACAIAALASGCEGDGIEVGTFEALWTIDGTTDPEACLFYAPDPAVGMDFEMLIYEGDYLVAQAHADCRDFGIQFDLAEGTYDGVATMIEPYTQEAVSTSVEVPAIQIFEDTRTTIDIEFPGASFPTL